MSKQNEMITHDGTCSYCGNIQPVLAASQQAADREISEKCECGGYRKEQRYLRADECIEKLCGTDCVNEGLCALPDEVIAGVKRMAKLINEYQIDAGTIKMGGIKLTLSMTSDDKIKVKRTDSSNTTKEA